MFESCFTMIDLNLVLRGFKSSGKFSMRKHSGKGIRIGKPRNA